MLVVYQTQSADMRNTRARQETSERRLHAMARFAAIDHETETSHAGGVRAVKPYYEDSAVQIYLGDCREILLTLPKVDLVLTDPPYNVGYHYHGYADSLPHQEYLKLIKEVCPMPCVILHYPEDMFDMSEAIGERPQDCVAWVYNANTPRKWRMLAWFGCKPDFGLVRQPYKNPNDARIKELVANGSGGSALYDWWNDEQVKNVSDEKTEHPCQIPTDIIRKAIGVTTAQTILDPFMGSGTTLRAAKDLGRKAIGIEIEERYCEIAARRMQQECLPLYSDKPIQATNTTQGFALA